MLEFIRADYPIALHGVSLSIGSADPPNPIYLQRLKSLCDEVDPFLVSDHLCWTGLPSQNFHDLLPLPFTHDTRDHVVDKIEKVQSVLRRQILIENVSSYFVYQFSEMTEWDFLAEVAKRAGCRILLDVNNVYVSAKNHGFDAKDYIDSLPTHLVGQIHLAGYTDMGKYLFDTHSKPVHPPVWDLFRLAAQKFSHSPVLIEWDDAIPEFPVLQEEALTAKKIWLEQNGS